MHHAISLLTVCSLAALLVRPALAQVPNAKPAEGFFGITKLHSVQVELSADDYPKMDPPPRAPFGAPRPAGPGRPVPGSADFGAGNFGYEFPYVPAKVTLDGRTLEHVGVRYKGSGTYLMSTRQAKRSLKFDFDRYDDKRTLDGIKKLNLNSGVMDPGKSREALAYAAFRAAGVPAPQTALAEVELTVPGKFARETLGVFTVVQQIDKAFLKAHFEDSDGLLLKPEGIRGLPHFGADPKAYEASYGPKNEADEAAWKRLIELTRLINVADEAEFRAQIAGYLDLDQFARFVAVNTALSSMDGFLGLGHNYYLYLAPKTNRFVFIPWDLDLAFGAFAIYGNAAQMAELSIDHPHVGQNKLIDRLLAVPEWKASYREHLEKISNAVLAERFVQEARAVDAALQEPLARERRAAEARKEPASGGMFGTASPPLAFVEKRRRSIEEQLAGKGTGYVPVQGGFGPGGFGPGGPGPGGAASAGRPLFHALDADQDGKLTEGELTAGMKKLMSDWDADRNGTLDARELTDGLQKLPPPRR